MPVDDDPGSTRAGLPPGLCGTCRYSRRVVSGRGSVFWLCGRSASDPRYPRYPVLPVLQCDGFERHVDHDAASREEGPDGPTTT